MNRYRVEIVAVTDGDIRGTAYVYASNDYHARQVALESITLTDDETLAVTELRKAS